MDHLFCFCPFARKILDGIMEVFSFNVDYSFGFHDTFLQVIRASFGPRMLNFWKLTWTTYFWMIWQVRNAAIHNDQKPVFSSFSAQLWAFVREAAGTDLGYNLNTCADLHCNSCLALSFDRQPHRKIISVRWVPPPLGFIKINSDSGESNGFLQGGVVFRNCLGFVEAAFTKKMGAWIGL